MGYLLRKSRAREADLLAELDRIVGLLIGEKVERIVLFGSLATGDATSRSDIDLIVIENTEQRFLDRLDRIYRLVVPRRAVDILVYTPAEAARLAEESSFVRRALAEGKVLYEKNAG